MTWRELTDEIIAERGEGCEVCGSPTIDMPHHALVYRSKKNKKLLDVKYNLLLVCRLHHIHSQDAMRQAWGLLKGRYGQSTMEEWITNLPLLVKPRISWLEDE